MEQQPNSPLAIAAFVPSFVGVCIPLVFPLSIARVGVTGECPSCDFTGAWMGQLDADPTLDVWSISTRDRAGPGGPVLGGELYDDRDDVNN